MIEKDIRKLLSIVEEKSAESKHQLNESIESQVVAEGRVDYNDPAPKAVVTYNDGEKLKAKLLTGTVKGDPVTWNDTMWGYTEKPDTIRKYKVGDTIDLIITSRGYYAVKPQSTSLIKEGIKQALNEGYWEDIGQAVMSFKGSELPRNYRKLDITSNSPHFKLHPEEFKKDVWDQLKDKGVALAKQAAPTKKVGGVSVTPELLLQVWRKLENVVSNVVPDGDPIDWMAPYLRRLGVDPVHAREILDMAVKRNYDKQSDYSKYLKDMWDAYGEMQGDEYQNPWK